MAVEFCLKAWDTGCEVILVNGSVVAGMQPKHGCRIWEQGMDDAPTVDQGQESWL